MSEMPIDWGEIIAGLPEGFVCADEQGRILFANPVAERILGRTQGDLVAQSLSDVFDFPPAHEVARNGAVGVVERVRGKRNDGTHVSLELSTTTIAVSRRRLMLILLHDPSVSDRAMATEQLEAERMSFLSLVAHQLRAPIQPILNSLRTIELAVSYGRVPPPDTMSYALRQALRLGRLVDVILRDASAIEHGNMEVNPSCFDLAAFVKDIVEDFRTTPFGARVEYTGPAKDVVVVSDQDRVQQILLSLIDNALKYSARQSTVRVEVDQLDARSRVRVIDKGIGIPPAEQAQIFGKFFRGSNVPSVSTGLGVGLYLARGLAHRLHGSLSVMSDVGRGSTFSLILPDEWPEEQPDDGCASKARGGDGVRSPF